MPYKDPERKQIWERLHRPQRLARRRELRRNAAAEHATQPEGISTSTGATTFLVSLAAGGAIAAYSPELGMGIGGLTLVVAAIYKKGWAWWVVGCFTLLVALLFFWLDQNAQNTKVTQTT